MGDPAIIISLPNTHSTYFLDRSKRVLTAHVFSVESTMHPQLPLVGNEMEAGFHRHSCVDLAEDDIV